MTCRGISNASHPCDIDCIVAAVAQTKALVLFFIVVVNLAVVVAASLKNYTPLYMGYIHKDPLYKLKPCTCRDSRTMYRKHSM